MMFQSHSLTARLVHRDDPQCPEGAKLMLGPVHRVGCAKGKSCRSPVRAPTTARATHYARLEHHMGAARPQVQPMYLCDSCAKAFAHQYGLGGSEDARA